MTVARVGVNGKTTQNTSRMIANREGGQGVALRVGDRQQRTEKDIREGQG